MLLSVVLLSLLSLVEGFYLDASSALPGIKTPWGTWQASNFDSTRQVYQWKNVRFGKAPTGSLRFQASKYPDSISDPNSVVSAAGAQCFQVDPTKPCTPGGSNPDPVFLADQSEDCLFLDINVPLSAIQNAAKGQKTTPVAVWIYGGAYVFGSKDTNSGGPNNNPLYDGLGMLDESQGNLIYVAGNYRLGAFGWLAGNTMEQQGYPNAGLSDQRLLFRFVQDFIGQVGGDAGQVTAYGESAGASSILMHLTSMHGDRPMQPNFTRAGMQSPAYEWNWDRKGTMEKSYQQFAQIAQCTSNPCKVSDLQKISADTMAWANQQFFQQTSRCTGLFPIGPSLDGNVLQELSPVALQKSHFNPMKSLIVSHVQNEAQSFIPPGFRYGDNPTDDTFNNFLSKFVPEKKGQALRNAIVQKYPVANYDNNQTLRVKAVIQDAVFTCNTRNLYDAYHSVSNVYMMQWSFGGEKAQHATDVPALFWKSDWKFYDFLTGPPASLGAIAAWAVSKSFKDWLAPSYEAYWTAHARSGNPNGPSKTTRKHQWNLATDNGESVTNAMIVGDIWFDNSFTDTINTHSACNFWQSAAAEVQNIVDQTSLGIIGEWDDVVEGPWIFEQEEL